MAFRASGSLSAEARQVVRLMAIRGFPSPAAPDSRRPCAGAANTCRRPPPGAWGGPPPPATQDLQPGPPLAPKEAAVLQLDGTGQVMLSACGTISGTAP
ncbi:hypothetical protein [Cyanobium sp. Morenito 9A2]|uniref:hypothetical protein n=1 Tax=Cyanobium sp. Morenito 9A2 TaxID=2823718 RepID=UPI0020CE2802|nr:hypothetical protein [Cyanobium sp. Morenito 9A2]MCP9848421.1 hypothetical protein [Cyanobium sp. Morenito 9A2]